MSVQLSPETRSRPCEVYFGGGGQTGAVKPSSLNCSPALKAQVLAQASIPLLIISALRCIDTSLQTTLNNQIVFCRGGSLLRGLGDRMKAELQKATQNEPQHPGIGIGIGIGNGNGNESELPSSVSLVFASGRKDASWMGASMLSTLSTFPSLSIQKQQYAEGKTNKAALLDNQIGAP